MKILTEQKKRAAAFALALLTGLGCALLYTNTLTHVALLSLPLILAATIATGISSIHHVNRFHAGSPLSERILTVATLTIFTLLLLELLKLTKVEDLVSLILPSFVSLPLLAAALFFAFKYMRDQSNSLATEGEKKSWSATIQIAIESGFFLFAGTLAYLWYNGLALFPNLSNSTVVLSLAHPGTVVLAGTIAAFGLYACYKAYQTMAHLDSSGTNKAYKGSLILLMLFELVMIVFAALSVAAVVHIHVWGAALSMVTPICLLLVATDVLGVTPYHKIEYESDHSERGEPITMSDDEGHEAGARLNPSQRTAPHARPATTARSS